MSIRGGCAAVWGWWRRNCVAVGVIVGLLILYGIKSELSGLEREFKAARYSSALRRF